MADVTRNGGLVQEGNPDVDFVKENDLELMVSGHELQVRERMLSLGNAQNRDIHGPRLVYL